MKSKICSNCNIKKSIDEFHKNITRIDGYHNWCKDCANSNRRKNYRLNIGRETINRRKYTIEHKEEKLIYDKNYYKSNKSKKAKQFKKYQQSINGKKSIMRTRNRRRRNLISEELFDNPFPEEVDVDWHHINNILIVPLPKQIHKLCHRGKDTIKHREECNNWIKKIYGFDIDELLSE